jgi:cell division protein FtsB
MLFLDANSWYFTHRELNKRIELLEEQKANLQSAREKDTIQIREFSNYDALEKFAREHFFMKKKNEVIYIIEYEDSLKTKTNE